MEKIQVTGDIKAINNGVLVIQTNEKYGATRLSGIIYQLKHKDNLNIVTETEIVKTRYRNATPIARYKLVEGHNHETF